MDRLYAFMIFSRQQHIIQCEPCPLVIGSWVKYGSWFAFFLQKIERPEVLIVCDAFDRDQLFVWIHLIYDEFGEFFKHSGCG